MMLDLYTWSTPNGYKISIMLEELGLPYAVHPINILEDEQFAPAFLAISPNNKIPVLVDPEGPNGEPVTLFESGAILLYLAEKYNRLIPQDPVQRIEVLKWLFWQMGGFGPMLGQANHFLKFAKEDVPYAKKRYRDEACRLYGVLDTQLSGKDFVCGEYSIADIAIFPWCQRHVWQQIDLADYPNVKRWYESLWQREAVKKGMTVPKPPQ